MHLSYIIYFYDSLLTVAVLKNISKVWLGTAVCEYVTSGLVFGCALLDVGRFWLRIFSGKTTIQYNLILYVCGTATLHIHIRILPTRCMMFLLLLIIAPICFDNSCRPSSGSLHVY
jgi:hypothetical protein